MSGSNTGRAPRTDAEWARDITQRVKSLENPTAARVGEWVITSQSGTLIAARNGETVNLVTSDGVDEEAVTSIIRSSGYAKQADLDATNAAVTDNTTAITNQGNSILDIFQDLTDLFTGQGNQQNQIDAVIARLDEVEATFAVTPAYVADVEDIATCARQSLVGYAGGSTSSAGSMSCADASHSHSGHTHSLSLDVICPRYSPDKLNFSSTSKVEYTPAIVDRKGHPGVMRWICGADGIFSVDAYYMALCVYDRSSGAIQKVWDPGDIKGSTDYSSPTEVEFDMGIADQLLTPGQLLFIAHMQIAPGLAQSTRGFAAAPQAGISRPSSLLLDAPSYQTPDRYSSIPSTIQLSSLVRINTRIPWAAISVSPE
ncbi:minor tail protein [Gordonia phage NHagos]|nr:minor tail protein [Gordonia phage NHagos]